MKAGEILQLTLEKILRIIAEDKGLTDPEKWARKRLEHCEISSDYHSYVWLKAHKRMWFGVKDAEFRSQPFILFREWINTEEPPSIKEMEIYTFSDLTNPFFLEKVKDSFQYEFESIKDFRLFFLTKPVKFQVLLGDKPCKLGEYNDLDKPYVLQPDLYRLSVKDHPEMDAYYLNTILLAVDLEKWRDSVDLKRQPDVPLKKPVYATDQLEVTYKGKPVPFAFVRDTPQEPLRLLWL